MQVIMEDAPLNHLKDGSTCFPAGGYQQGGSLSLLTLSALKPHEDKNTFYWY